MIDEASSLSDGRDSGSGDSFSKACIDTLNRMLTEHAEDFTCVLSGYEEDIRRDVLVINPGMDRRFTTIFRIDGYTSSELKQIALLKLKNKGLQLADESIIKLEFFDNKNMFSSYAGDVEVFCDKLATAHAKRVFGREEKTTLTKEDVEDGIKMFEELKRKKEDESTSHLNMYC